VGITVAFSVYNKPFKLLGYPKWTSKVSSGFTKDIPTKSSKKKKKKGKRERETQTEKQKGFTNKNTNIYTWEKLAYILTSQNTHATKTSTCI